ncbi:MAG TPA: SDR family oxidoreductase, partial [Polyangiales bacterium]|nr:SDR family oxidoreductase [Polyangiales bacterium]
MQESDRIRRSASRVVVITGGTAGVGRATARRFARAGASVAVLARGRAGLEATQRELSTLGGAGLALEVDVSDPESVRRAALRIEAELGPIDVSINNAMTTVYGRITDIAPEDFKRVTEVTYLGYVWGTQAALAVMKPRNRGLIIQVGSSLAYRGIPLQSAYCAAKHAIRAFTDSLRCELLHDDLDIQLTMVQLPALNTPQFDHCANQMEFRPQPVPPIYQPEVAAEAIYDASRRRRREVYVGGSTVQLILAQKLMPGLVDRYLAAK